MKINALGFIEVCGLVPAIEAADAMVKAANVRLIKQHHMAPGMVTVVVEGDVAACRAAVDAGVAAAGRLGPVISRLEIPRPTSDTESFILDHLDDIDSMGSQPLGDNSGNNSSKSPKKSTSNNAKEVEAEKNTQKKDETKNKKSQKSPVKETINPVLNQSEIELNNKSLIAFVKRHKKGVTFRELLEHFKTNADDLEKALNDLLKSQKITFKQMRYSVKK